ncbi:hypothetical protein [Jeotgalicoccus sp. FSL K6-3177]|uniref:hypothetical protein n=1 Tax=Jeotgalicoccus sp. FSL K6-3177 TaxID=2921494 RepID=UPI0030FD7A9C
MSDISIDNWQKLLKVYHESCGEESSKQKTDQKFDSASISDDLHVIVNESYINNEDIKRIYLEGTRAIFKMQDEKYVEVKEGSQRLEVNFYHKAEITTVEFGRDAYTIIPEKAIFTDKKGETFTLNKNASEYKYNLKNFIEL